MNVPLAYMLVLVIVIVCIVYSNGGVYPFSTSRVQKSGPSHIVIIRHGEKPKGDKKNEISKDNFLNAKGKTRATALVDWVQNTVPQTLTGGNPIVATFSPDPGPFGEDSRPRQTVSPTAFALDLPLYGKSRYFETDSAAKEILGDPYYSGRAVLVCWEHTCIQKLVESLCGQKVPYWQSVDFSSVILLTQTQSGYQISFSCESLLSGDDEACKTYTDYKSQTCTVY